jgi:hypothetical protein
MREEARASLRGKRRLWKARHLLGDVADGGFGAQFVEMVVEDLRGREEATAWELVSVRRITGSSVFERERVLSG